MGRALARVLLAMTATAISAAYPFSDHEHAPATPPVIARKGWCIEGTPTRTTGECMCRWSSKEACSGPGCQYQYGLSWYHHTCESCLCLPKPYENKYNMLRGHMANRRDIERIEVTPRGEVP